VTIVLDGQALRVLLVHRKEFVSADRSGCAVDELPHGVDKIGFEDTYATRAVDVRDVEVIERRQELCLAPEACSRSESPARTSGRTFNVMKSMTS
jgi:hypothetical protein